MIKILFVCFIFFSATYSKAVILIPGKIENPLRADKILTEKYNAKKKSMARYRQVLIARYLAKKKAQAARVAAMASAPANDDHRLQSKSILSDSGQMEPVKQLQEVKETNR